MQYLVGALNSIDKYESTGIIIILYSMWLKIKQIIETTNQTTYCEFKQHNGVLNHETQNSLGYLVYGNCCRKVQKNRWCSL